MMIRPATEADIPAMITLLKLSLGEGSTSKSEAYWRWKHLDNPFGPSPILLAEVEGQLVGIRAFLRWRWTQGEQEYSALRAVDTATHPDFQGKGIFKKLTLQLVEDCRAAGDDFIFNTPNAQSRPGYLKMGWLSLGQVPVRLQVRRPWKMLQRKLQRGPLPDLQQTFSYENYAPATAFQQLEGSSWWNKSIHEKITTPLSLAYLHWRYVTCPVQDYGALVGEDFLLVFYVREQPPGRELRLVQFLCGEQASRKKLRRSLNKICRQYGIDFVSLAPTAEPKASRMASLLGFLPGLSIGPILTFRALQDRSKHLADLGFWEYDLGALELF